MRKKWKAYLESLPNPLEFLQADEFQDKYEHEKTNLPAIFVEENGTPRQIVSASQINESRFIEELKTLIDDGLKALNEN